MALFLIPVAGGVGWFLLRSSEVAELPAVPFREVPSAAADPLWERTAPAVPPLALPALDTSDDFIRGLLRRLSSHPRWAAWLVTDELVRRFVRVTVTVAGGSSPASELEFAAPAGEFSVQGNGGRLYVAPASYRRYDLLTEAFVSFDTGGAVQLYHQLHPLFERAYAELGIVEYTFDQVFARAVRNLLAVRLPDGPVEVRQDEAVYVFVDPRFEGLSEADKHVLRLGPENAARFQGKLGELADGLGIPRRDDG